MKQLRKDYFLEEFVLVNSSVDVRSSFLADDKSEKICNICKNSKTSSNYIITKSIESVKLEKFDSSEQDLFTIEQKNRTTFFITDSSHKKISKLTVNKLHKLLTLVQETTKEMISEDMKNIQIFVNSGTNSGGNVVHNGFEITNLPVMSPKLNTEIQASKKLILDLGICPMCRVINFETGGPRQILSTVNFLAFCPWTSSHSFEFWIYPKSHQYSFAFIDNHELEDLAQILRSTLGGMDNILNNPSYSIVFHNSLNELDFEIHWHIEIFPKIFNKNGFENGFGIYVNSITPEKSAEILGKAARKELASLIGVV